MKNRILGYSHTWRSSRTDADSNRERATPAGERLTQLGRSIENFAVGHPVVSLTAAICVGVLLGWFIKRR